MSEETAEYFTSDTHSRKPFEQLTITDDYMFKTVMKNPARVKPLLEMVLGKKIRDIVTKGDSVGKLKTSYIIFIITYDQFGKGWYMYPFETLCSWDSSINMNDATQWIVLNTTGTKDAEGHEVSNEIKDTLSYMNNGIPRSDYTRMLDDAVKEIKQSEERRLEYMSINANAGDLLEVGEYRRVVSSVRDTTFPDDILTAVLKIKLDTIKIIRFVINAHPDWNDEIAAEKVLDLEDEGFDADKAIAEDLTTI